MYAYKIILAILFSINGVFAQDDFHEVAQQRWLSAFEINFTKILKAGTKIREPEDTNIVIAEILIHNLKFEVLKDCLIYKVPDHNKKGILKIVSVSKKQNCKDFVMNKPIVQKENIYNFGFEEHKGYFRLLLDTEVLEYFPKNIVTPKEYKLYDTSFSNTRWPGITVSLVKSGKGTKMVEGELCYDLNETCEVVVKDKCSQCPAGVIEVKASQCKTGYRKYCSQKSCGGKDEYACLRGHKASEYTGNYCIPGSPVGYCKDSLKVFCENGELICR